MFKDLYDRLFWYGFDDSNSDDSDKKKTMFGGTKGKFNGLDLFDDADRPKRKKMERSKTMRDNVGSSRQYYESDNNIYDEDSEYYYDDENEDEEENEIVNSENQEDEESDNNEYYYEEYEYEEMVEFDDNQYDDRGIVVTEEEYPQQPQQFSPITMNEQNDNVMISDNDDDRYDDRYEDIREKTEEDVMNSYEQKRYQSTMYEQRRTKSSSTSPTFAKKNFRGKRRQERSTPIINLMDKVFQLDPAQVESNAKEYNDRVGLDMNGIPRKRYAGGEGRSQDNTRKGYAYRYEKEKTTVSPDIQTNENSSQNSTTTQVQGENVIDVEATVQSKDPEARKSKQQKGSNKQRKWMDRAEAYEQVPPKGVSAWGPEGDIGVDIRKKAAMDAMEDIRRAKLVLQKKEKMVVNAENEIISLKTEMVTQKQRLSSSTRNDGRNSIIREKIMVINLEVEEAARQLRRMRKEVQLSAEKLDKLENRHWALISQFQADEELTKATQKEEIRDEVIATNNGSANNKDD